MSSLIADILSKASGTSSRYAPVKFSRGTFLHFYYLKPTVAGEADCINTVKFIADSSKRHLQSNQVRALERRWLFGGG